MLLNPVASTIPKWTMFEILRWAQLLNWLVDLNENLYGGDGIEDDLNSVLLTPVASNQSKMADV
jgi:hypothetical protein